MTVSDMVVKEAGWIKWLASTYHPNNAQNAEDLAADTIYRCLRNPSSFREDGNFRIWASVIMRNTFITWYHHEACVRFDGLAEANPLTEYSADTYVLIREMQKTISDCRQRACSIECVLLFAEGWSYREIADKLGVKLQTVKSRIRLGRDILRKALE